MSPRSLTSLAAALVALTGCAHGPATTTVAAAVPAPAASAVRPPGAASAPTGVAPAAGAPAVAVLPPVVNPLPLFALVTRDAKRFGGMITAWQKDEKVWLELSEHDFNVPFFL
ncbi:MAG: hypothetical protein RLZZ373_870, partial [Pseudomonadota bacterium]